ncbi:DUF6261 family protein [Parasediminibacterium paludis]|uniref:DUF6261 family protein n=1 Tax=Parasediminibacterium paludis TaxID=908966 RepID=A0ABV8PXR1_9BACT
MIKKISLKQLVATELYQFFSLVLGIVDVANPTVSKIKTQRDVLNDLIHKLQAAINKEKGFALTKVIEALDTRRDNAISGLMMWIAGLTKHPNSVTKEAAKIVKAYLDTHGNAIASQNYQTESAILSKIVADYKSNAAWKIALDGLGGKDWMDEIEAANTAFITTYQQRTSDMGVATNAELFHYLAYTCSNCIFSTYRYCRNTLQNSNCRWRRYNSAKKMYR